MSRPKNRAADPSRHQRVTLKDIAHVADVHVMTVSNALHNTRSVAPQTRDRVLRIAKELNYIPNSAARALVAGRTGMVAVACGAINEPYYANMVHLLQKCIEADGYKLVLMHKPSNVKDLVHQTGSLAVDGAIAIDVNHCTEKFHSHPAVPCVAIGAHPQELLDYVRVDVREAVDEALQRMIDAGCQRIACVIDTSCPVDQGEAWLQAYLSFMQRVGRSPEIINLHTEKAGCNHGMMPWNKLVSQMKVTGCPDGWFCINHQITTCVHYVLRDLGCTIPSDGLLVCCEGQNHMKYFDPSLSTIVQPMKEMCALAWQFLNQRMADRSLPLRQAVFDGQLLVRESLRKPQEV